MVFGECRPTLLLLSPPRLIPKMWSFPPLQVPLWAPTVAPWPTISQLPLPGLRLRFLQQMQLRSSSTDTTTNEELWRQQKGRKSMRERLIERPWANHKTSLNQWQIVKYNLIVYTSFTVLYHISFDLNFPKLQSKKKSYFSAQLLKTILLSYIVWMRTETSCFYPVVLQTSDFMSQSCNCNSTKREQLEQADMKKKCTKQMGETIEL